MKGNLLGTVIIFFIVFFVIWALAAWVFKSNEIGFMLGLFAGFIVSGAGTFIWHHNTGR